MKKYTLWLLISVLTLVGCGQTGPLFLPSAETDKSEQDKAKKNKGELANELGPPSQPSQ